MDVEGAGRPGTLKIELACGNSLLTGGLGERAEPLVTRAFAALWHGVALRPAQLGNAEEAEAVLRELAELGRCELDGDGRVVSAHGLTLLETRHRIVAGGVARHTWCGFDAVGIPAALGVDATAVTACPRCDRPIEVAVVAGEPRRADAAVVWLPASAGQHLMADFCSRSNVFCSADDLRAWRASEPGDGDAITVERAASVGRDTWANVADVDAIWATLDQG